MWGHPGMEYGFPIDDFVIFSDAGVQASQRIAEQPDPSLQRIDSATSLGEELLTIYKDQTLSDFQLVSGDVSFPVHKIVPSARSPVFRAMFSSDMKESDATSLDVPDVDAHALDRMLTFLYAGTVDDLQWEDAADMYYAADKYQVLCLKQECSALLRSGIGVSSACDVLALADRHRDDDLTSFVHDFILDHYDEVLLSEEWGTFLETDAYLAGMTARAVYKGKLQDPK